MSTPKISIITICRNEEKRIEKTIESVFYQTYSNREHIVIDGGSDDTTLNILNRFKNSFSYFESTPDRGVYHAQNKGIQHAQGDYLLFLNGGDYFPRPNVLELMMNRAKTKADILYGDLVIDYGHGVLKLGNSPPKIRADFLFKSTLWHPVSLIRRELFEKYGYYDESYKICADYDFFLKVILVHNATTEHIPVAVTVFNTEGIGSQKKHEKLHREERRRAQNQHLSQKMIELIKFNLSLQKRYKFFFNSIHAKIYRSLKKIKFFRLIFRKLNKACEKSWFIFRKLSGKETAEKWMNLDSFKGH